MFNYLEFKKAVVKNLQDVLNIEIKRGLAPFKLQELRTEIQRVHGDINRINQKRGK